MTRRGLLDEAVRFVDWYLRLVTGDARRRPARRRISMCWRAVLPLAHGVPATLVLRDYHVDNLMRLDGRDGIAACGLLDFQDARARAGHLRSGVAPGRRAPRRARAAAPRA